MLTFSSPTIRAPASQKWWFPLSVARRKPAVNAGVGENFGLMVTMVPPLFQSNISRAGSYRNSQLSLTA